MITNGAHVDEIQQCLGQVRPASGVSARDSPLGGLGKKAETGMRVRFLEPVMDKFMYGTSIFFNPEF